MHAGRPRVTLLNVSRSTQTVTNRFLTVVLSPDNSPYMAPGTGQMSGACSSRTPSSTESRPPPDRRAPDKLPVRCFVRCVQLSAKPLGLATGQKRRGTGHVRCVPRACVRCFAPLCLARPRASPHRTGATGQNLSVRCSVRCSSEHSSQLLSPPLLTTTNTKVFHHLVHVC